MKYKFGSFNLKNLGAASKRDFDTLAEIIRGEGFDIVAFQEILSEGKALNYFIEHCLPGWGIVWDEPKDSSDYSKVRDKRGEGYAFVWNKRVFKKAESATESGNREFEPRILNKNGRDVSVDCSFFARAPLFARFIPINGGFFEFRLINVHLHFGDNTKSEIEKRRQEYEVLTKGIFPAISMDRKYGNNREAYTIVMGDYNLNLYKPRGEAESRIIKSTYIDAEYRTENQLIHTVQDELTTLKADSDVDSDGANRGYSQNYDHFTFDALLFEKEEIKYRYNRVDAVRKYYNDDFDEYRVNISDHVPIILEISMGIE